MRLIAIALVGLAIAPTAAACPRTTVGEVEHEVMCLECGVPLDVAENSLQAKQQRAFIAREVAACHTKDQIKDALTAQYGDRVLAAPKAKGFGLTAYLVPIAAVLLGAAGIALAVRRWRRRAPEPAAAAAAPADPGETARLDADLTRYDT